MKLAVAGLSGVSVTDLFHAMRALGQPIGSTLGRPLAKGQKQLDQLEQQLSQIVDSAKQQVLTANYETLTQAQQTLEQDQQTYPTALADISQTVHPFTLDTSDWQLLETLSANLAQPLATLQELAHTYGGQAAQQALSRFQAQIPS